VPWSGDGFVARQRHARQCWRFTLIANGVAHRAPLPHGAARNAKVALPAGQPPLAELQEDAIADRIETGRARALLEQEDFRAARSGDVDKWGAQNGGDFVGRHAEGERADIGTFGVADREPADARRYDEPTHDPLPTGPHRVRARPGFVNPGRWGL